MTSINESILSVQTRANQAQQQGPQRRARDLALHLQLSECDLVHAGYEGLTSQQLAGSLDDMFAQLGELGRVMALTRNDWCVHERHGRYDGHVQQGPVHMMLGPDIDLRAFVNRWKYAYAVEQGGRRSLQFFDACGAAVHKVYATDASDMQAFDAYVARYATEKGDVPAVTTAPAGTQQAPQSSDEAVRAAWMALKDTHDFHPMLRKLGVSRLHALSVAGADLAQQVAGDAAEQMLTEAARMGLPIMCFVGNPGMVQIHTGPVQNLRRTGDWFNVLDDNFNLHLNTAAVASAWVVNKPTTDGWVRSLELYHASGEQIVQFFGRRQEGQTEMAQWRALLDTFCADPLAV